MSLNISVDEISNYLLHNKYLLTALELDFELIERGFENKHLRNFFTNPDNFEKVSNTCDNPVLRIRSSPSESTIDSCDFAKLSDDGNQFYDDKVKVLEFELRKKNDEVKKLREELTQMSTCNVQKSFNADGSGVSSLSNDNTRDANTNVGTAPNGPLLAYENRALNFLINEYLMQQGLKLTSVSFTEEIFNQDLDSWDDVGLNIPKLPGLAGLLRSKWTPSPSASVESITVEIGIQTEVYVAEEMTALRQEVAQLTADLKQAHTQLQASEAQASLSELHIRDQNLLIGQLKKDVNDTKSKLICVQRDFNQESLKFRKTLGGGGSNSTNQPSSGDQDRSRSEIISLTTTSGEGSVAELVPSDVPSNPLPGDECDHEDGDLDDAVTGLVDQRQQEPVREEESVDERHAGEERFAPVALKRLVGLLTVNDTADENENSVALVESLDEAISMVTEMLPRLFEAVGNKENQDIITLLVQSACLHGNSKKREELLKMLINLHPSPDDAQRRFVLRQIDRLSTYLGPYRIEAELITQVWEMLYEVQKLTPNLRILLANICGVIAPLAPVNHPQEVDQDRNLCTATLRSSLLLSILQQMLEEEADRRVRPHILASLASTVPWLHDADKVVPLVQSILAPLLWHNPKLTSADSTDPDVTISMDTVARQLLLPGVAQWCLEVGILNSALLTDMLDMLERLLERGEDMPFTLMTAIMDLVLSLVPFIEIWIKRSTPNIFDTESNEPLESVGPTAGDSVVSSPVLDQGLAVDEAEYSVLQSRFRHYTSLNVHLDEDQGENDIHAGDVTCCWREWSELAWLRTQLLTRLARLLTAITPPRHRPARLAIEDPRVVAELAKTQFTSTNLKATDLVCSTSRLIFELSVRLSVPAVTQTVLPVFSSRVYQASSKAADCDLRMDAVTSGLLSGHCAVLSALIHLENYSPSSVDALRRFLTNAVFLVAAEHLPLDGIRHSLAVIRQCCSLKSASGGDGVRFFVVDVVLPALQPCLACPDVAVRVLVCLLLQQVVTLTSVASQKSSGGGGGPGEEVYMALHSVLAALVDPSAADSVPSANTAGLSENALSHETVKVMSLGPLVALLQVDTVPASVHAHVFDLLSELMNESVNFKGKPDSERTQLPSSEVYITTLIQTVNVIGPLSSESYRNEVILPWLFGITEINNATSDTARRSSIAMILYSTFSTLSYYLEAKSAFEAYLLPSLDRLRLDMQELYPESVREVENMSLDIRRRFVEARNRPAPASDSGVTSMRTKLSIGFGGLMTRTSSPASPAVSGAIPASSSSSILMRLRDMRENSDSSSASTNLSNLFSRRK